MEQFIEKADVLIEALPYIRSFQGKVVVVKYGGAALNQDEVRKSIFQDLIFMRLVGIRPVLIHGGGKEISEEIRKLGKEPRFVAGLRVTDRETIEVVERTLGAINQRITEEVVQLGGRARGMSGKEDKIFFAKKYEAQEDVGFVGRITFVHAAPVEKVVRQNIIPIVTPLGLGQDGEAYNINADEASAQLAVGLGAEKLVLLTDVAGILKDPENPASLVTHVGLAEIPALIERGVVQDGMIPKTQSASEAIAGGVKKVHVLDGRIKHSLLLEIFTDKGVGTEIVKENGDTGTPR
ncbi:MAG: acetylglutamate kinase [Candidatus Omnitrophica bacterium]|nr:acetylglutamate kinase [Candidatus Omnitrophota bacterium]